MSQLDQLKQQQKAKPFIACIDPRHLQSIKIGNIFLYTFAGHPEYYSSHATVLEHLSHVEISCSVHHPNQAI